MSGFIAAVSRERRPVDSGNLYALADTYELLRESGTRREGRAPFAHAIGFESPAARSPMLEADQGSWAIMIGALRGRASPLGASLEELDGQFALVSYDAELTRLTVATDPFGLRAVYSAERNGTTYFCTSALVLARHLHAGPDFDGQLMFLRAGYQLGPATSWEGIERLDAAVAMTFDFDGGTGRRVYWRPQFDYDAARLGFGEAVDRSLKTLETTCAASFSKDDSYWTDLTGGYDTRLLNVLLDRVGADFTTNTVGPASSAEVQIAGKVARAAGWEWTPIDLHERWPDVISAMLPLAVGWSDCRLDVLQLSEVLWAHARKAVTMQPLLGGSGYEIWTGQAWGQEFWRTGRSTKVDLDNLIDMRWLASPVPSGILVGNASDHIRRALHAQALEWIEPYRGEPNTFQLNVLWAQRRAVAHVGAFMNASTCFLEGELPAYRKLDFELAASIHPRHRSRHRLSRALIARINPAVAAVATTRGGPAEPMRLGNLHRFAPYYGTLGRKAVEKISGKRLGRALLADVPPGDQRVLDGRRRVLEELDLSADGLRAVGMYDGSGVERLLASARRGDVRDGTMLGRIVTLELSLRAADPRVTPPSVGDARKRIAGLLSEQR